MQAKISTKFDTAKESAAVFVVSEGRILLQRYKFEGIWCCEPVIGKFIEAGEDPIKALVKLEEEQIGISLPPTYICTVVSYINKPNPDGRVRLTSPIYLLEIDASTKAQIKENKQQRWMDVAEVDESKEIRVDDKLIFTRILEGNYKDLTLDVDQMGKWARPTLLGWKEEK